MVARRQEHPVRLRRSIPTATTMPATSSATRRQAKSKVKAKIFTQLMFRHWNHYFDGKYSHLFIGLGRWRRGARPDARRARCAAVQPRRAGPVQLLARRQRGRLHQQPRRGAGHQHQQRYLRRAGGGRRAEEDHHQSRQRRHADVFARWQVHRLSLAVARRLRERPLPPDAVRARDRQDHRPDAELRSLGRFDGVVAGFEDRSTSPPRTKAKRRSTSSTSAQPNPWPQELVAGFNDSPTPTPDGKTLVFDQHVGRRAQRNLQLRR